LLLLQVVFCSLLFNQNSFAVDYYWVGGTGDWSDNPNHWATTSNGSIFHASAPTSADDVYFDFYSYSPGDTVYIDVLAFCNNLDFQGGGGIVSQNANLTCAGTIEVSYCEFFSNGFDIIAYGLDAGLGNLIGFVPRELNLAGSTVTFTGDGLVVNIYNNYFFDEDFTGTVFNFTYGGVNPVTADMGGSGIQYTQINISPTYFTFDDAVNSDTVVVDPGVNLRIDDDISDKLTVYKMVMDGTCGSPIFLGSTSSNQAYLDMSLQTVSASNIVLENINGNNGTYNAVNSIDQGNNTGWSINENPSTTSYFWVGGTGNWSDPTHWALATGGAADACIPGPNDNVFFDLNSGSGFTTTVDNNAYCGSMTWSGVLGNPFLAGNNSLNMKGSMILDANMTAPFTGDYNFLSSAVETITTNNVTVKGDIYFLDDAGDWSLTDDLTTTKEILQDSGSFSTGGFNISADAFISELASTRVLDISNSTILLTGVDSTWILNSLGLTFTSTGSEIIVNHTNPDKSIVYGGSETYEIFRFFNAQSELFDNNTFAKVELDAGVSLAIESGSDQTMDSLLAVGTCASIITIESTNNTSPPANINFTPNDTLYVYYCNIFNITGGNLTGNRAYVGINSDLGYTTTGWDTTSTGSGTAFYWVGGTGDWSDLSHWEDVSGTPMVCLPTIRDTVYFNNASFATTGNTVTTDIEASCFRMDWTGSEVDQPIFELSFNVNIRENAILNSDMSITNSNEFAQMKFVPNGNNSTFETFNSDVETNIFFNGLDLNDTLYLDGNLNLDDDSDLISGTGTFNSNSDTIRAGVFMTSGVNGKSVILGSSICDLRTGLSFIDFAPASDQMTLDAGTSHITILGTSGVDFFNGDSLTYYDVTINSTSTQPTLMSGGNTFNDLTLTAGLRLQIDSMETQTVDGTFSAIGNCTDSIFIFSSSATNATTLDLTNAGSAECVNPEGIDIATTVLTAYFSTDVGNNNALWFFDPAVPTTAGIAVAYDHCMGDVVNFTNTSTAYAGGISALTFEWDFGEDTLTTDTSSVQDPSYIFSSDGQHYITLITEYTNFCLDTLVDSIQINNPELTIVSSDGDSEICAGETVEFSGSVYTGAGIVLYDYQINGGSVQNSDSCCYTTSALVNGDIVTCIMSANGCLDTSLNVFTFTVNSAPTVNLFSSVPSSIICDGDLVTFTGTGAEKYQFYLDNVPVSIYSTTDTYNASTLTTGQVITMAGKDTSTSCLDTASQSFTMTVNALPVPTMITSDADQVICAGDPVSFTASNSTNYEFFVNGTSVQGPSAVNVYNSTTLSNLDVITVVGTSNGCSALSSDSFTYFVNAIPNTIIANNTGSVICEGGVVNFTAYNANTYEFFLNGGSVQGPNGDFTYSNSTLVNGDQVMVVGSVNGCVQSSFVQTFTVNPSPVPTLLSSDADNIICEGDSVTFTAGGSATQFQFFLNGSSVQGPSTLTTYTNYNLSNGDVVTVGGYQSGCFDYAAATYTFTVTPQFNVNLFDSDADDAICLGENVDFTGVGTAITTFELFVDGISQGTNGTGLFSLTTLPVGNPEISLSGTKLGCTYMADDTITFNVSPIPTIDMTSSDANNIICAGDSITFTATGGATYEFLINSISQGVSAIDTLFSDGFNNGDVIDLVGYSGGCSSNSLSSFTIVVDPIPPTALSSSDVNNIICEGESITYTASGADNYEFFIDGVSQGAPSPTTTLTSTSFTGTSTIYVEGYNTGCSASSNSFNLIVNSLPIIEVGISDADTSICQGENVTITGTGAGTYELFINGISQGPATTNNVFNSNSLVDGDQVTMEGEGVNGCFNTSMDLFTFTVVPNPVVVMTSSDPDSSICVGETVTFTGSGASSYQYFVNGALASVGSVYVTDSLTNGQIVQIYGTDNICSTFGNSIPFSVYSYPVTSIICDDLDQIICAGDQVVFTGLGAFDFEFFINGGSVQGPSLQDSLITTTLNDGDVISVEGGNNGCVSPSSTITITVSPFPATTLTSSSAGQICYGDQVDFTGGAGITYEFFINGISQDPPSASNLFSTTELNDGDIVTVLAFNGQCSALSPGVATGVDVMPLVLSAVPGNIICVGDQVDFTGTGADTYEFFIDGTSVQGPSGTPTYSTTALTDGQVVSLQGFLAATGCTQWAQTSQLFVVMDNPIVTALSSTTICEGDSVVLESSYSTWNQWYWDSTILPGETDTVYEAYNAGAYHVEVTLGGVGEIWGLGNNIEGQLGDNSIFASLFSVEAIGLLDIEEIESGKEFNIVKDNTGAVFAWGMNGNGQLGDGSFTTSLVPITTSITNAVDVSAGYEFSVAALSTGAVMSWGKNDLGQLGQGNFATTNFPFAIVGLTNIVHVSAGENHVLALKDDGTVYSWGDNSSGQLGQGNFTDSNTPLLVASISGIASIHTGDNHSFAVDSSGQMYVWGNNAYGQLGVNGITFSDIPVLNTIPNVQMADGGTDHSIVLTTNQKVYTFGNNDFGQLGNGTTVSEFNPQKIDTLDAVIHVEAAFSQSAVIKGDNSIWTWGRNDAGQLGTENLIQQNDPVYIPNLTGAADFGLGENHSSYLVMQENSCASNSVDVIVNPEPAVTITGFGGLLTATPPGDTYQWYIDGILIPGGTTQSVTPTTFGWYTCEVTYPGGCVSLSEAYPWGVVGVQEDDMFAFMVHPNPSNGIVNVSGEFTKYDEFEIIIFDLLGNQVYNKVYNTIAQTVSLDLDYLARGSYMLYVNSNEGVLGKRKVIIQ